MLSKYSVFPSKYQVFATEILQILEPLKAVFAVIAILKILVQILPLVWSCTVHNCLSGCTARLALWDVEELSEKLRHLLQAPDAAGDR